MLSSPNKKFVLSRNFLNFLRIFASSKGSFFKFGEILPHLREFDHHFWARGRELDKKLPGWPGFASSKKFSRGLPGGGYTQLELTETLDPQISCPKQAELIPSDSDSWLESSAGLYQDSCKFYIRHAKLVLLGFLIEEESENQF